MEKLCLQSKRYYINSAITIALMLLFPLLPNIGQITDLGMHILGITFGMLYGWIFVELAWPSILGLLILGSIGYSSLNEVLGSVFGNSSVVLSFVFFGFSQLLSELCVTDYIAGKILSLKIIKGRPWVVVSTIIMIAYVLALLTDIFPAIFLTWGLALSVIDISGYKRNHPIVGFLVCSIVFASTMGGMVLPFKITPVIFCNMFMNVSGNTVDPAKFLIFMLAISLLSIVLLILIGKYFLKIDASRIILTEETISIYNQPGTFNQKLGLLLIAVFIVVLLLPSFLPTTIPFIAFLTNWSTVGCLCLLIIIPAILRKSDGTAVVQIKTMMTGVGWDFIWLLCAIMGLNPALNLPEAGIMDTVSGAILPILENVSPILLIILAGIIVTIFTQVVVNMVVGAMFIPIFIQFCMSIGANAVACFLIMYVGLNIAFATPAASMPAALMHGHENVVPKQAYGYGFLFMVIGLAITIIIGLPLGNILL